MYGHERQQIPATGADLAANNKLFLEVARKALKWEEPGEPVRIAGPIYFVGTKGLGVFLFTSSEGHILMNTGMPSSGTMIADSIRKLGFKPEEIRLMINRHAHIDHAGAFAYFEQQNPRAVMAVMKDDVAAMESGDRDDFEYANDFVYPAVNYDLDGTRERAKTEGINAWPSEGYRRFIAEKKRAFEDQSTSSWA